MARVAALEADRADYRAVLAATNALGARINGQQETIDALTHRVDALTTRVDALTHRVDALTERVEANTAAIQAHTAAIDALTTRIEALTVRADAHQESINALGLKLAAHQAETRNKFDELSAELQVQRLENTQRFNSVDEQFAEVKDLLIRALDR